MAKGTDIKGPMRPTDLGFVQASIVPQEVFDVFNEEIASRWSGSSAVVKQDYVVSTILERLEWDPNDRRAVFDNGYLNIEEAYRAAGWNVVYDKPAYNETYTANWTFTKAK
jgi:hypothetical protein